MLDSRDKDKREQKNKRSGQKMHKMNLKHLDIRD